MKIASCLLPLLFALLSACDSIKHTVRESYRYELYIDFRYVSYQGQNDRQHLYLEIDSTAGIWYTGKLIVDFKDTLSIGGFSKGSRLVTSYRLPGAPPTPHSSRGLKIWSSGPTGQIRDSLTIEEQAASGGIIAGKTVLYRKPRGTCR